MSTAPANLSHHSSVSSPAPASPPRAGQTPLLFRRMWAYSCRSANVLRLAEWRQLTSMTAGPPSASANPATPSPGILSCMANTLRDSIFSLTMLYLFLSLSSPRPVHRGGPIPRAAALSAAADSGLWPSAALRTSGASSPFIASSISAALSWTKRAFRTTSRTGRESLAPAGPPPRRLYLGTAVPGASAMRSTDMGRLNLVDILFRSRRLTSDSTVAHLRMRSGSRPVSPASSSTSQPSLSSTHLSTAGLTLMVMVFDTAPVDGRRLFAYAAGTGLDRAPSGDAGEGGSASPARRPRSRCGAAGRRRRGDADCAPAARSLPLPFARLSSASLPGPGAASAHYAFPLLLGCAHLV